MRGDDAVMRHQASAPALKGGDHAVGERLRAEDLVGRAADRGTAGRRDRIMDRRDVLFQDRHGGGVGGVGMHDGIEIRPRLEDVAVEAPFARRQHVAGKGGVPVHRHHMLGRQLVVGDAGRRDEEAVAVADADVAGRALVDAEAVHAAAGLDQLGAQRAFFLVHRRRSFFNSSGFTSSGRAAACRRGSARRPRRSCRRPW